MTEKEEHPRQLFSFNKVSLCSLLSHPPLSSTGSAEIPLYHCSAIITSEEGVCPFFLNFGQCAQGWGNSGFMSPKPPPGRADPQIQGWGNATSHPLVREPPWRHCSGQACPEGIIMSKWIKSCHREWSGIFFAIPQGFRPVGTGLQRSAGATRQVWQQQNQVFLKAISFISAFDSRGFAAVEEF